MGSAESSLSAGGAMRGNGDMPPWVLVIFEFADWQSRARMMILSKRWWRNCNDPSFYRLLANRLAVENGVYVPPVLPSSETWRSMFYDLYKLRSLWRPAEELSLSELSVSPKKSALKHDQYESASERFKISVYARFRPMNKVTKKGVDADGNPVTDEEIEVTLPLHQRLAMIKMSRNLKSNKEALKILTSEGGWFGSRWNSLGDKENVSNENVNHVQTRGGATFDADQNIPKFALQMRAEKEKTSSLKDLKKGGLKAQNEDRMVASVHTVDPVSGRVVMVAPDVGLREFSFDSVLHPKATQKSVYDASARRLVMDFLNGFNSTAIVYGQTGSGKTFSMFGADATAAKPATSAQQLDGRGIVPRACEEIFQALQQRRRVNGIDSEISVSYVEVFGDEVSDLLKRGARCGHSKVAAQQYVLSGAAERTIHSIEEVEEVLRIGEQQKRRAATHMNDRSTRAHSLFIMSLKQTHPDTSVTLHSRLFLADLGGSEQVKKSGVDAGHTREGGTEQFSVGFELGAHMREAVNINLGLLALKKCIESLNNRALYTPYKDSKLTMLLSAGLGGNSKTSVIVCSSMDPQHASETVATLRFGEKCALIETSARNNATMLAGVLAALDQQIATLEAEITVKERWEERHEQRADALAEEGTFEMAAGGVETKKVYMLVGAEEERQQLEQLLIRRAKFIGSEPLLDEDTDIDPTEDVRVTGLQSDPDQVVVKKKSANPRKKVVGFGREYAELYGLGGKFDESAEESAENTRFAQKIADEAAMPSAVRSHRGTKNWATGAPIAEEDASVLERKAQRVKRNRLAYSGISS